MAVEEILRDALGKSTAEARADPRIQLLLSGGLSQPEFRAFFRNFIVTHLNSVQVLSFLLSVAPREGSDLLKENLLEELGLEVGEKAHPDMLLDLARGLGFSDAEVALLRAQAEEAKRRFVAVPLGGKTVRDLGLEVMLETVAFESVLSQVSDGIAQALTSHYGLAGTAVRWFTLHGEVDVRHAEEGRQTLAQFITFHRFTEEQVRAAVRAVFAQNPCLRSYFPPGQKSGSTRVRRVAIFPLTIPFQQAFAHALATRGTSDSVVVAIESEDGVKGFGEGVPRPYVTGEDMESVTAVLQESVAPGLLGLELDAGEFAIGQVSEVIEQARGRLARRGGVVAWNAALCAVELALLDLAFRRAGVSLGQWLPPARDHVVYSGVIDAADPDVAAALARRYAGARISQLKVKVGVGDDAHRLAAVRSAAGDGVRLRADANAAWPDGPAAVAALRRLVQFGLEAIEQPVPAADFEGMRQVREELGLKVIADEALVTEDGARRLLEAGACDGFNVRVSKCGGLMASKAIAEIGIEAGMDIIIGAQVGESSILSAAGRLLAAHLARAEYCEGSFGTHLLAEDIALEPVMFGMGGRGDLLTGAGLGVEVDEERLARLSSGPVLVER